MEPKLLHNVHDPHRRRVYQNLTLSQQLLDRAKPEALLAALLGEIESLLRSCEERAASEDFTEPTMSYVTIEYVIEEVPRSEDESI